MAETNFAEKLNADPSEFFEHVNDLIEKRTEDADREAI